ncbi:MAG: lamin tail domain-containing protein, partial [Candidatus Sumerlaeia bacterium]|nr:lamin tail domain-containing protein [Candidatus Sumerlaeia bacterium]
MVAAFLCLLAHGAAPAFVVINEIHYHPRNNENALEFVELLNDSPTTEDLTGWKFFSGIEYVFPKGTTIPPHGYLVVCADPEAVRRRYKIENVAGPFSGELDNKGAVIELRNAADVRVDWVDYADDDPWPAGADGTGHTIALTDPLADNERGIAWALSEEAGGTPGRRNFAAGPPRPDIVINEVLLDAKADKWIELHNLTTATVSLAGYALSDEADTLRKFVVPKGTVLGPRGFVAFTDKQLKFKLSPKQRKIFLSTPQGRVCDAVACRKVPAESSVGRWPDGASAWFAMKQPTAGRPNVAHLNRDVVINEIMYHPFSDRDDDEYVELYNRGSAPADLSGWAFTKGIEFTFARGTILPPDSYLVVAKNRRALACLLYT